MAKYLLELGVEELPYGLIDPISKQIKENFEKNLEENNAKYTEIKTYTTPRRLVFIIDGLTEMQVDTEQTFRGPNVKVAYDVNGNPTPAAIGFAKKFNANVADLYKIQDAGQEYIGVKVCIKGKSIVEIIQNIAADCVLKVQGSHFMRWAALDEKFSRPIRWIVSILDDKEIPIEITNIKSSKKSRAHRFCEEKFPEITDVDSYLSIMNSHNVIVDEEERKSAIVKAVEELAASINATVKIEPELLKEVTNIVEWPRPVLGNFDEKYLAIPEPVIVTVMASHQRYFPVYDKTGKLLNAFITVANYVGTDFDNIKNGNERVIKARLDDAIFFYNEDIKKPLYDRIDDLDGMTFQKGLGSLKDKVSRIAKISDKIAKGLGYNEEEPSYKNIMRTALYCKADLTTSLVFEFTELQGVIGAHYAKVFNENNEVAKGIKEHYYPLVADAELASGAEGQIVGIADKLDTICAVFALDKIPSGSVDPLGVRRAAVGILQTIMQKRLNVNLIDLIEFSLSILDLQLENKEALKNNIIAFFKQRLKGIFQGKYQTDFIDAALNVKNSLKSLSNISENLKLISSVADTEDFDKVVAAHTRINKLAKNKKDNEAEEKTSFVTKDILSTNTTMAKNSDVIYKVKSDNVSPALFQTQAEEDLYKYVTMLNTKQIYTSNEFYTLLVNFVPVINKFFDDVMVMDKDVNIKNNRLNLLALADAEFFKVADFTKIIK